MAEYLPPATGQGVKSGKHQAGKNKSSRKKGRSKPRPSRNNAGSSLPPTSAGTISPPPPRVDLSQEAAQAPARVVETGNPAIAPERVTTWQKPLPHHRQAYAAIDLGTNNCRLLIARPSGEHFVVIDAFSRVVRLGEGLAQTGRLSDAAMDRALGALHVCADKLRKRNVHLARSVATEACRRATNGQQFIDRVLEETGIHLNIITAQEEARLAVLGCHILLEQGTGPAMIFDIGGGSTEMVLVETGETVPRILDWQSVPWGVVSLTESIGAIADDPHARAAAYAEMRRRVDEGFADFCERVGPMRSAARGEGRIRLLGTSGTVTTLASVHLELPQYDRRAVDGLVVPADSMRDISRRLATMTPAERIALPCIGRERSDLVVAGCAILESIIDIWPADRLGIADRGIREGILRSLMAIGADPRSPKRTEAA
ncbi:MAG: exopolyphosphatase [Sphingomonadales bacterium 39-62-4]|nr:MAG: exopolyphosphatase [Sphingomonadales bacterium 39-62-4]